MRDWPRKVTARHRRAVFIDRDGTITADTHFPHRVAELQFLPHSLEALKLFASFPVHVIVVSNQAGISLGKFSSKDMTAFNLALRSQAEEVGARIDAFYYCPHKEPKHLKPGERPCACAKPAPGMLLEAADDFCLDLQESFMIGDKLSDVAAGKAAGCTAILVETGKAGRERDEEVSAVPDRITADLLEAAHHICPLANQGQASKPDAIGR